MNLFLKLLFLVNLVFAGVMVYMTLDLKQANREMVATVKQLRGDKASLQKNLSKIEAALSEQKEMQTDTVAKLHDERRANEQLKIREEDLQRELKDRQEAATDLKEKLNAAHLAKTQLNQKLEAQKKEIWTRDEQISRIGVAYEEMKKKYQEANEVATSALQSKGVRTPARADGVWARSGKVASINREFNTVVVDIGQGNRVLPNAVGTIHRKQKLVGKIKVTDATRTGVCAAEILLDWKKAEVLPGDQIIF